MQLNTLIDHTLLAPAATKEQVMRVIDETAAHQFASVCLNPSWVQLAVERLKGSKSKVCTVIDFPLGATTSETKAFEAAEAIKNGADEIDMVINIGAAKSGDWALVKSDIEMVNKEKGDGLLKVIIETCLLTDDEKIKACQAAKEAGADFVKTSTGFSTGGATAADVALMRRTVGDSMGVKASGGIHTASEAEAMVLAGANRIGTSAGIGIIHGEEFKNDGY